jgi:hypothetical protein
MIGAKPLAIDLFCGLGGWTEGLLAEGYNVVGFDIERHDYGTGGYPAQLVLQDVLTLHGSQFRNAALIVASPPCQAYSYRAMPWNKLWRENSRMDDDGAPVTNHRIPDTIENDLFWTCFRIQREACEAAGRHIPMVVENVKGAQPFVGRAVYHFGSFYLWGDLPALMPSSKHKKHSADLPKTERGRSSWFHGNSTADNRLFGTKQTGSSNRRKAASAQIAKIPLPLSRHIARVYYPIA